MPTLPAEPVQPTFARDRALYRAAVQEALDGAAALMGKLVTAACLQLKAQEAAQVDANAGARLAEAARQLRAHEAQLTQRYPQLLEAAFTSPQADWGPGVAAAAELPFDQLEQMDEDQVQTSVVLARLQQAASHAAQASLRDLDSLVCSLLGLATVRPEANPLRPEVYAKALQGALAETRLSVTQQAHWLGAMATPLGHELRTLYEKLCATLRHKGVLALSYGLGEVTAQPGPGVPPSAANPARAPTSPAAGVPRPAGPLLRGKTETLLTLDTLRKLLAGELGAQPQVNRVAQFEADFAQQFEGAGRAAEPTVDFDATVPSALEALTEMKQVDAVVQSLQQRRVQPSGAADPADDSPEGQRQALRRSARDTAQALSLEVMSLMVDNIGSDTRLLEPVRALVRSLEPALLRLVLADPRFFIDKQHPARQLLHAVTDRSMAFETPADSGFAAFVQELHQTLAPLLQATEPGAELFASLLATLQQQWSVHDQPRAQHRDTAMEVLRHAEARNLLAEKIAHSVTAHPDSARVPALVIDFLRGPWAQVVAQARIRQGTGSAAAEKFQALIPALLWSAHPDLARANPSKLTRLVPRLLTTLREGLDTIHYPGTRSAVFMEGLMAIHQQLFRASGAAPQMDVQATGAAHSQDPAEPWIAPQEALASNFYAPQDVVTEPLASPAQDAPLAPDFNLLSGPVPLADSDLPLGSWVEIWVDGHWARSQLTWASPHGSLFLFTGVFGATQSMTRRSRDRLWAQGRLRLMAAHPIVEGALDAVAQQALQNSVNGDI